MPRTATKKTNVQAAFELYEQLLLEAIEALSTADALTPTQRLRWITTLSQLNENNDGETVLRRYAVDLEDEVPVAADALRDAHSALVDALNCMPNLGRV